MVNNILSNNLLLETMPQEIIAKINHWIAKFPHQHKKSAVIPILNIVQNYNNGYLTKELLNAVADYLAIPKIAVYEVASFYSMFELKPIGKYKLSVCTNISCMLCGCNKLAEHLQKKLNINFGETTNDLKFTLKQVECIAACDKAPVMLVNNKCFANLTIESVDQILEDLIND